MEAIKGRLKILASAVEGRVWERTIGSVVGAGGDKLRRTRPKGARSLRKFRLFSKFTRGKVGEISIRRHCECTRNPTV